MKEERKRVWGKKTGFIVINYHMKWNKNEGTKRHDK